jgi:hypothetical protein
MVATIPAMTGIQQRKRRQTRREVPLVLSIDEERLVGGCEDAAGSRSGGGLSGKEA